MKKLLQKSEYVKNSLISVLGVGFAAVIPIILQPFLGRMFTPEEVNAMGLYVTITSVFAIVANFRYGYVVAITKNDDEAKNVLIGSIIISFIFSGILLVFLLFFKDQIVTLFGIESAVSDWFFFMPLSVFLISSYIGFNGWLNRKKQYMAMAVNKGVRRGAEGLFQLLFGKLKIAGGMIYGIIIGDVINFLVHVFQFIKSGGNFKNISTSAVKISLKKYIDFPKFNLLPSLLDTLSLALPFLFVSAFYSEEISGQFYFSQWVLALPLVLISVAISQVLLQKLTEKRDLGLKMTPILMRHIYFLASLGIVGTALVYLYGQELFLIFLGPQWGMAGNMASLMVGAYAIRFVVAPLSQIFFALEKIKIVSFWQFGYFIGISSLLLVRGLQIKDFIFYYVIIEIVFYLFYLILILNVSNKYDKKVEL